MNMDEMGTMIPGWLTAVSWVFVGLALLCAAAILYDVFGRGYRQRTSVMSVVWPITALYFGPLALPAYYRWGRPRSEKWQKEHGSAPEKSLPVAAATGGTPGGAASAIGHVLGVPLVVFLGLTIAGQALWVMILFIAIIATVLLFAFEYYFSTVPTRGLSRGKGLGVALLIALVTVLAFDVGMGGWMLVMHFLLFMPPLTDVTFLFLMQIGLILGFLTGYPAVLWLVRRGVKTTA
ncbi:MAG: DUF4396 domain-containing protein [Actinomycetota bacterium]|jgi:hypothetical protein|nr:DUF4396 domain-containing protein [Actinomycetota bacterium]